MLTFSHCILLYLVAGAYLHESNFGATLLSQIWSVMLIGLLWEYIFDSRMAYYLCLPLIAYVSYSEIMRMPTDADWERHGMQAVYPSGSPIQLYLPVEKPKITVS